MSLVSNVANGTSLFPNTSRSTKKAAAADPAATAGASSSTASAADFQKLAQAVTNALQSAQSGGSSTDPNQTITDALTKIFSNGSLASVGSTGGGDDASTASPKDAAAASSATSSFADTLKSFGVTPEQFQSDLKAALQKAKGGNVNSSAAFASFPAGSLVNAVG